MKNEFTACATDDQQSQNDTENWSSVLLNKPTEDLSTLLTNIFKTIPILPTENNQPINGVDILKLIKNHLNSNYSDNSIRNCISKLSRNENSPIAKAARGHGYFQRKSTVNNHSDSSDANEPLTLLSNDQEAGKRNQQLEEKFRAAYITHMNFSGKYSICIDHTKSKKMIKGENIWTHPDAITNTWNPSIFAENENSDDLIFDQRNNAANLVLQGEVERTAIAVVRILGGVVQPRPKFL